MAVREVRSCDFKTSKGEDCGKDAEDYGFAVDTGRYEIDLCEDHNKKLLEAMAPYVAVARPAAPRLSGPPRKRQALRASVPGYNTKEVREWLRANGEDVKDAGRIPTPLLEKYTAAHPRVAGSVMIG